MSARARLHALVSVLVLAGCASGPSAPSVQLTCRTDAECAEGQLCFPEGCGDPGGRVVVEITGDTRLGAHAQDVALGDGGVTPLLDLSLLEPMVVGGEFQRNMTPEGHPDDRVSFTDTVSVLAVGRSALIPDLSRVYVATFTNPERGTWTLPVGSGVYSVTALPADVSVPPAVSSRVEVTPGHNAAVSFAFPSVDGAPTLTGRVVKRAASGTGVGEVPLSQAAMDIQAVDSSTGRVLSQRVKVSSGTPGSRGDFVLVLSPEANELTSVTLVVSPREAGALVPTKSFSVELPFPDVLTLEMGDFGDPLPQVRGELYGTDNLPVANARVYLEGPVGGGGTFRSRTVSTDATGQFSVDLLPTGVNGPYTLVALPPSSSPAGVLRASVRTRAAAGQVAELDPKRLVCPDRLTVQVALLRPDGSPARAIPVIATAIAQLKDQPDRPLPSEATETTSDDSGVVRLELDPAIYRLDFLPGESLPRTSRVVAVRPGDVDGKGTSLQAIDLGALTLWKGRKVTGTVTGPLAGSRASLANASLRFFRVTQVEGRPIGLLLGEALSDDRGGYTVVLPSR